MRIISRKILFSGIIGNIIEAYDFTIWALLAQFIAKEFLPPHSALISVFALFFVGYLVKPFGGLMMGLAADQLGRKTILTISMILMGISTTFVGLLPSYSSIGLFSVFFLLLFRIIQVIALSGEYISSTVLLIESCDKQSRGYYGSWVSFGTTVGMFFASLTAFIITSEINIHLLPSWIWRIAFAFSFIITIIGFWIRKTVPESLEYVLANARKSALPQHAIFKELIATFKTHGAESISTFILVWVGVTTTFLIYIYAPIHLTTINTMHSHQAFFINTASLALVVLLIPLGGKISDRYGRINTLFFALLSLLLLILPYFIYISKGNLLQIAAVHMIVAVPSALIFGLTPTLITEIFPLSVRCSIAGLIYSISSCLAGGLTPLLAIYLANNLSLQYAPSGLLIISTILGLFILIKLRKKTTSALENSIGSFNSSTGIDPL